MFLSLCEYLVRMKYFFFFILCSWIEFDNDVVYYWVSFWVCVDRCCSVEVFFISSVILGDFGDSGCSNYCYFSDIIFFVLLEFLL